MFGYKAFNDDLTCKEFQYKVGKTFKMYPNPICYARGFHFCKDLKDCFYYYDFGSKVCEIESLGDIDTRDNKIFCTNEIKIVRELSFEEICNIIGIDVDLANILIKTFKITKEFYSKRYEIGKNHWINRSDIKPSYWNIHLSFGVMCRNIWAQISMIFKGIEFFRPGKSVGKFLFDYNDGAFHQVERLEGEDLEFFEYLKENL